ncbi:MAG: TolC family protein [Bacteroidales bacterium]|jgi:outer membrane protein|nr:TolC family protein [Bacteroidales bacterium]
MKKRIAAFLACCLTGISIMAQSDTNEWTLKDCIDYAIEHNIDIKQRLLQKDNAEIILNTSQMSRLPDLSASVGQEWRFGFASVLNGVSVGNQAQSNTGFSVNSSIPLFTGFRINNTIARDRLELAAAVKNMEKAKEDLALNIVSLYLQALFNKELLRVNSEQAALTALQVTRTESLVEAGKIPASQLYDIKAQVAKDELNVVQAENNVLLSLLDLAQLLDLNDMERFDILSPDANQLDNTSSASFLLPGDLYANAVTVRPHILEQELKLKSSEKSLKVAQSGHWPTLSLGIGYNTSFYYDYNSSTNSSFAKQFKDNSREYVGLNLSIPIFNRFEVRNQVNSARIAIANQQLSLENSKKSLYKEIQTAYYNAVGAQEKYKAANRAVEASQESFRYAQERYESGKSTVFEFSEVKTKLVQSLSEQIQAKYDFIFRSKILDFYNGKEIMN